MFVAKMNASATTARDFICKHQATALQAVEQYARKRSGYQQGDGSRQRDRAHHLA
jgi:hypothetical protein